MRVFALWQQELLGSPTDPDSVLSRQFNDWRAGVAQIIRRAILRKPRNLGASSESTMPPLARTAIWSANTPPDANVSADGPSSGQAGARCSAGRLVGAKRFDPTSRSGVSHKTINRHLEREALAAAQFGEPAGACSGRGRKAWQRR
ncbi:hypothetical protein [Nocardia colli]|uniref:hypothetical protein n=1 Tax=Nocardia colli TaxID=2545717 RepID=UPI0035DE0123